MCCVTLSHCGGVSGDAGLWETKLFVDPHAVSDKDVSQKEDEWKRGRWHAVIWIDNPPGGWLIAPLLLLLDPLRGPALMPLHLNDVAEAPLLDTAAAWIRDPRQSQNIELFIFLQFWTKVQKIFKHGEDKCPITSQRDYGTWVYFVLCFHLISHYLGFILRRINGLKLQIAPFSYISSEATCPRLWRTKISPVLKVCCKLMTYAIKTFSWWPCLLREIVI